MEGQCKHVWLLRSGRAGVRVQCERCQSEVHVVVDVDDGRLRYSTFYHERDARVTYADYRQVAEWIAAQLQDRIMTEGLPPGARSRRRRAVRRVA